MFCLHNVVGVFSEISARTITRIRLTARARRRSDAPSVTNGNVAGSRYLDGHPKVASVTYAGLPNSVYYDRVQAQYPNGAGALYSFSLTGGYEDGKKVWALLPFCTQLELSNHICPHVASCLIIAEAHTDASGGLCSWWRAPGSSRTWPTWGTPGR